MKYYLYLIMGMLLFSCAWVPQGEDEPPIQPYEPVVDPQFINRSVLTGDPCFPPCWQGLTIGQSTKAETMERLAAMPFLDLANSSEQASNYQDNSIPEREVGTLMLVPCVEPEDEICLWLTFHEGIFKEVSQTFNFTVTTEEIVRRYGPPTYITTSAWGAECGGCIIDLVWETPPVVFSSADLRCKEGAELCQAIGAGGGIPPNYRIGGFHTSIRLMQGTDEVTSVPWPGFLIEEGMANPLDVLPEKPPEVVFLELHSAEVFPITDSFLYVFLGEKSYGYLMLRNGALAITLPWEEFLQIPDGTPVTFGSPPDLGGRKFGEFNK